MAAPSRSFLIVERLLLIEHQNGLSHSKAHFLCCHIQSGKLDTAPEALKKTFAVNNIVCKLLGLYLLLKGQ